MQAKVLAHDKKKKQHEKGNAAADRKISKMLKPPRDSSRIDTAMTENESNAPIIHRTTRTILLGITRMSAEPDGRCVCASSLV